MGSSPAPRPSWAAAKTNRKNPAGPVAPGRAGGGVGENVRNNGFKPGTATFLRDEESDQESPFGPVCAGYMLGDKTLLRGIPDFTTRDFTPPDDEKGDQGSEGGG